MRDAIQRVRQQLREVICGLNGHDAVLHYSARRISLLCTSCGHESPGWDVRDDVDDARQRAKASRARLQQRIRRVA